MEGTEYLETLKSLQEKIIELEHQVTRSPTLGKLAEALSKAQGAFEHAKKSEENPHFRMKYADLASCWDAVRKALSDNGLAVIQTTVDTSPPFVTVETLLAHKSDEWIKGVLTMKSVSNSKEKGIYDNPTPQGIGSTITYARRYALSAIVGIAPEDDDGNAGSGDGYKGKGKGRGKTPNEQPAPGGKARMEEAKRKAKEAAEKGSKKKEDKKEAPEEEKTVREKLKEAISTICGGDKKFFNDTLQECSKFTKEGQERALHDMKQIDDPKTNETWIRASYGKAKEFIEKMEEDKR